MSGPFGSSQWMYSSGGFYPTTIEQSLRFNDDDSAYLSWTPASAGNRKTWTWSGWVKRGNLGINSMIFSAGTGNTDRTYLFSSADTLQLRTVIGAAEGNLNTTAVYRDPSSWYHIVCKYDSTQATSSDRMAIYVNGEKITSFSTETYPALNTDSYMSSTQIHMISQDSRGNGLYEWDGYMAEINFIDGQALDPTDFGEFKSGVWVAKSYEGSYGTNGFYLNFSDSANIGDDLSGNANDWTANNLVATDVVLDSPTNNFATLNPLDDYANARETLSEGNLKATSTASDALSSSTILFPSSTKWYFEALQVSGTSINANIFGVFGRAEYRDQSNSTASIVVDGSTVTTSISGFDAGDILGMALDASTGDFEFFKNGSSVYSGTSSLGFVDQPANFYQSASGLTHIFNFGQDSSFAGNKTAQGNTDDNGVGDFYYAPPSGYLALCTANLPDPAIDPAQDESPSDYFDISLWTGNGSSQDITGLTFQPDWIWYKERSSTSNHLLFDAIRGATTYLISASTAAEATSADTMTSFNSDGFSVGSNPASNESGQTYVGWSWLAGNGTSSNTDGSISSTVSVNQKAGFSVVSWTGDGASKTIGHGLGAMPNFIILKNRDDVENWEIMYDNTNPTFSMVFGTAAARLSNYFTSVSSTTFGVGPYNRSNGSGDSMIAYCFAEVEGYSKFGSYTGNGSADGPFVYTGFRPAWVMFKPTNRADEWRIMDTARNTYNVLDGQLYANNSSAELFSTSYYIDFLSNGFKPRSGHDGFNRSGDTYIYMAFAENPFKYANAR